MPGNLTFAKLLAEHLRQQDRSASWLAQRLGVHPSTVSRWLDGSTRPDSPEQVMRIADCLGVHDAARTQLLAAAGYAAAPVTRQAASQAASQADAAAWPQWFVQAVAAAPEWAVAPLLARPALYAAMPWPAPSLLSLDGCGDQGIDLGQQRLAVSSSFGGYFAGLLERSHAYCDLANQIDAPTPQLSLPLAPLERMALALNYPRGPRMLVVAADAGMGKSTVAAQLVRCLLRQGDFDLLIGDSAKHRGVDAVTGRVHAVDPGFYDAATCFARLRQQLGLPPGGSAATADIADRLAGRRVLIVLDNLDTVAQRDALLQPLSRLLTRDVRAILTTRVAVALPSLAHACMVAHLHPLTAATLPAFLQWHVDHYSGSFPLLQQAVLVSLSPAQVEQLLARTGGVPLLVQLVFSSVARLSWAYLDYLPHVYGDELLAFLYAERWAELAALGPAGACAQAILHMVATGQERGARVDMAALTRWAGGYGLLPLLQDGLGLLYERFLLVGEAEGEGSLALFPSLVEFLARMSERVSDDG